VTWDQDCGAADPRESLYIADEVFFTEPREITPIRSVDKITVDRQDRAMTKSLQAEFYGIVRGEKKTATTG